MATINKEDFQKEVGLALLEVLANLPDWNKDPAIVAVQAKVLISDNSTKGAAIVDALVACLPRCHGIHRKSMFWTILREYLESSEEIVTAYLSGFPSSVTPGERDGLRKYLIKKEFDPELIEKCLLRFGHRKKAVRLDSGGSGSLLPYLC